jgi:hypothetical protein
MTRNEIHPYLPMDVKSLFYFQSDFGITGEISGAHFSLFWKYNGMSFHFGVTVEFPLILHKNLFMIHTTKVTYFYAPVDSRPNLWHKAAKYFGKGQFPTYLLIY